MLGHESLNQGAFANSRVPSHQHKLAASRACLLEAPVQLFKLRLALE
jgi:hypothetical protein